MAQSKYVAGSIVATPKGDVRILSRRRGKNPSSGRVVHPRVVIEVLSTGTILDVQQGNLLNGKFNDYRERSVYGVGYIGSSLKLPGRGAYSIVRRIYDLWANMLKRAYGGYKTSYTGVTVDARWHNFTTFLSTVSQLPGYAEWERGEIPMALDKDVRGVEKRIYSLDTCSFIPSTENVRESALRRWHGSSASCKHNDRSSKQLFNSADAGAHSGSRQGV